LLLRNRHKQGESLHKNPCCCIWRLS